MVAAENAIRWSDAARTAFGRNRLPVRVTATWSLPAWIAFGATPAIASVDAFTISSSGVPAIWGGVPESVARTKNSAVPAAVAVPLILPVALSSSSPAGNAPVLVDHL